MAVDQVIVLAKLYLGNICELEGKKEDLLVRLDNDTAACKVLGGHVHL